MTRTSQKNSTTGLALVLVSLLSLIAIALPAHALTTITDQGITAPDFNPSSSVFQKSYDAILCRGANATDDAAKLRNATQCTIVCLSTDGECSQRVIASLNATSNAGRKASLLIRPGDYPLNSSISVSLNMSDITVDGYGARLYAVKSGITVFGLQGLSNSRDIVTYHIHGLTIDMNNTADVGFNVFNPEYGEFNDITVENRAVGAHWMFNLWCNIGNYSCRGPVVNNLRIINSTTTTWEGVTLTQLDDAQVNGLSCKNFKFTCGIDYNSYRTKWQHIYDNSNATENHPTNILNVGTLNTEIEDVDAPNSTILIIYDRTPANVDGYIDIQNARVSKIGDFGNTGVCNAQGERGYWCDLYGPYIAHPTITIENSRILSVGEGIGIRPGFVNSSYSWAYPHFVSISNTYFHAGWAGEIDAQVLILDSNRFDNATWNTAGFNYLFLLMGQDVVIQGNTAIGSSPTQRLFALDEGQNITGSNGAGYKNLSNMFGTSTATVQLKNMVLKTGTTQLVGVI